MKRGELKRTNGLKRSEGPRRKTEKTRAFIERARAAGLSRDPIKMEEFRRRRDPVGERGARAAAAVARKRKEGPLSPREWRIAVATAADLRCIVSGARAYDVLDPMFDAHHPLPKGELRERGLHAFVYDPRNGAFVLHSLHLQHEYAHRAAQRIPRERLPASVWSFCRQLDELAGHEWATAMVERLHPAAGSSGTRWRETG